MKKSTTLIAAAAIAASTMSPAFAGAVSDPIVEGEPVMIIEDEGSSVNPWIFILLGIGVAVAIAS